MHWLLESAKEYQGFYLKIGSEGDVYLHRQLSERLALLMDFLDGFTVFNGATDSMKDLKVEGLDRGLARGFYRWPTAWRISWTGSQGSAVLALKQLTRTSVGNWAIGGVSMAIVRVDLRSPVYSRSYGLLELIM